MAADENIQLYLDNVDQLFEPRILNPFKNREMQVSGMELIYTKVRISSPRFQPAIVLNLPAGTYNADEIKTAIEAYCDFKIRQARMEHQILKGERYFGLISGFIFMTLCLAVSYLMMNTGYADFIKFYIKEGLFIVGWVSMWRPTEILIFDWWPYRKILKTYSYIKSMPVHIHT